MQSLFFRHAVLVLAASLLAACGGGQQAANPVSTKTAAMKSYALSAAREVGAYFAEWSVYQRAYEVADIDSSGSADKLTFINYAFSNIVPANGGYECAIGDPWAAYQRKPARTVGNTPAPAWDAQLSGNFLQLKALKARHPELRVFISLGGWTWSSHFSEAASTDALRRQLAASCIDLYIRGNLPVNNAQGGAGVAAGVFDGIDIDWEYPGGGGADPGKASAADRENYTLLLAEFRRQLDEQGKVTGKRYGLTAAIGAGKDKIDAIEPAKLAQYLDWMNVMSYDFHGAWTAVGPTNFHAHLYADPSSGVDREYAGDKAITNLVAAGAPPDKLLLGIPFYGRGWSGVGPGPNGDGLYQPATGAARGLVEAGINDYRVLKAVPGMRHIHPVTRQLYLYTSEGEWWSYDDAQVLATKMQYVRDHGLRGAFAWALDGDANGELVQEMGKLR
jgi:chitinase